ncbi:MAG: hypothetical protein AB7F78_13180 [Hyphomicrobiaceae bacterium]
MHIEILVEDGSGTKMLGELVPRIIGPYANPHTWRLHAYKGIGRMPRDLATSADPSKRILLDQLPRLLQGYGKTPGIDAVVVVVDTDKRNCESFLGELNKLLESCVPQPRTLFRLAIEEMEAWYLGDRNALLVAYPRAKTAILDKYKQDSVCGTWELLADAIVPGGNATIAKAGWPMAGQVKHEWAEKITPHMDIANNISPSFAKFREGLLRITLVV